MFFLRGILSKVLLTWYWCSNKFRSYMVWICDLYLATVQFSTNPLALQDLISELSLTEAMTYYFCSKSGAHSWQWANYSPSTTRVNYKLAGGFKGDFSFVGYQASNCKTNNNEHELKVTGWNPFIAHILFSFFQNLCTRTVMYMHWLGTLQRKERLAWRCSTVRYQVVLIKTSLHIY